MKTELKKRGLQREWNLKFSIKRKNWQLENKQNLLSMLVTDQLSQRSQSCDRVFCSSFDTCKNSHYRVTVTWKKGVKKIATFMSSLATESRLKHCAWKILLACKFRLQIMPLLKTSRTSNAFSLKQKRCAQFCVETSSSLSSRASKIITTYWGHFLRKLLGNEEESCENPLGSFTSFAHLS